MNKLYKLIIITLFFLGTPNLSVIAQVVYKPGAVILNSGETLKGYLGFAGEVQAAQELLYKPSLASAPTAYTPSDAAVYSFDQGKMYESYSIGQGQQLFLEVLVKGPASLFFLKERGGNERFFIRREQEQLMELIEETRSINNSGKMYKVTVKPYIGVLNIAFAGCDEVQRRADKVRLDQHSLKKVVNDYNSCVAPEQQSYVNSDDKKPVVNFGLLTGGSATQLVFVGHPSEERFYGDFDLAANLTGGITLDLSVPKVSEKLSLHTGVTYIRFKTESYKKAHGIHGNAGLMEEHYVDFQGDILRMPFMLRYTYPEGKIRPYVNVGPNLSYMLNVSGERNTIVGRETVNPREYQKPALEAYRKSIFGVSMGVGAITTLTEKMNLVTEVRHERGDSFSVLFTVRTTSLLVGVRF
ncbi:MAG: hypothetical protein LPK07_07035 [Hymenobacteraceae bacterium]|nr:hypothetical protein [Hymenobacteraceae bacterium]MDX5481416.1 hypothetical protein [Hymenobacteraceae bacterium]MDX5481421.1 hypothetical protein [Hymenobacteraceae bacterium]